MTTIIVLDRIQDRQRANVIPNAVCLSLQDHSEGRPMKVREQRKHRVRENNSRKLSSELLALTRGVSMKQKNTTATTIVKQAPARENRVKMIPMFSVKERNSICFRVQRLWSLFDQNSRGHFVHSVESKTTHILCYYTAQSKYSYLKLLHKFWSNRLLQLILSPILLLTSPSAHCTQEKQHTGLPLIAAWR